MRLKKWKLITAIALSCTLLMGMGLTSDAANIADGAANDMTEEEAESLQQYDEAFYQRQSQSAENYQQLQEKLSASARSNNLFAEDYGGAYIDDNGTLVVYLKSASEDIVDQVKSISNDTIIKPCTYSFNELTNTMDMINDFKLSGADDFAGKFNYYKLSDSENKIIVEFDELTPENIADFKQKVSDSEAVTFTESMDEGIEDASIHAGSQLDSSSGSASVGYRAKINGVAGIVTASHFAKKGDSISAGGTTIGSCTASVYSGAVDAAFVKVTNGTPTNTIDGGSTTLSTTISEPGVGTVINKRGMTTKSTSGKVISTNATWTINGVTFTNLTSADYSSDSGDSGGIVYSYVSSTGTRYTLGIHKGRKDGYAHFIKANEINKSLGTSRY